jgi:hypothetical protein
VTEIVWKRNVTKIYIEVLCTSAGQGAKRFIRQSYKALPLWELTADRNVPSSRSLLPLLFSTLILRTDYTWNKCPPLSLRELLLYFVYLMLI